jgi:feruloyl esterase
LSRASHSACDAQDGLVDGQITNPRACNFNPSALRCVAGDGPDCLTDAQLAVAQAMYAGMRTSSGMQRYAGAMPGSEAEWDPNFGDNGRYGPFIGHYVFSKTSPPYDWRRDLNWDEQFDQIKTFITPVTAAPSPDLTAFKTRGGKLVQFHGWADPIVPPQGSPAYYNALIQFEKMKTLSRPEYDAAVEKLSASQVAADALAMTSTVQNYHRLFMVPDVGHCRGGTAPEAIGGGFPEPAKAQRTPESHIVSALARWVEQGVAPTAIIATKYNDNGAITRQRPICAYPQVALYRGSGDVNAAGSFSCVTPQAEQMPVNATDILLIQNSLRQRDVLGPRR